MFSLSDLDQVLVCILFQLTALSNIQSIVMAEFCKQKRWITIQLNIMRPSVDAHSGEGDPRTPAGKELSMITLECQHKTTSDAYREGSVLGRNS